MSRRSRRRLVRAAGDSPVTSRCPRAARPWAVERSVRAAEAAPRIASTISGVTTSHTLTDTVIALETNAYTPATYVLQGEGMRRRRSTGESPKAPRPGRGGRGERLLPAGGSRRVRGARPARLRPAVLREPWRLHGPGARRGRHRGVRCVQPRDGDPRSGRGMVEDRPRHDPGRSREGRRRRADPPPRSVARRHSPAPPRS